MPESSKAPLTHFGQLGPPFRRESLDLKDSQKENVCKNAACGEGRELPEQPKKQLEVEIEIDSFY